MKKFVVEIKEVGNDHVMTTSFIGEKTREEVVEFYGLEKPRR